MQPKRFNSRIFSCIIFLVLSALACSSLPFRLPFLKPADIRISGPTPVKIDEDWKLLMSETFYESSSVFPDHEINASNGSLAVSTENGKSIWKLQYENGVIGLGDFPFPTDTYTDFYYSVTGRQIKCPATCRYGIMFRNTDEGGYEFTIQESDRAFNFFYIASGGGKNKVFNNIAYSSAIQSGSPNALAVKAEGSQISLWINDTLVAQVQSDISLSGNVGISVLASGDSGEAEFEFDDFQVYGP
jgi:hypothetical protein